MLADDHVIVREGFASFCESQAGLSVAGQCGDGAAALEMIQLLRPDFAILDLNMPKLTGVQVVKGADLKCVTRTIILSIEKDRDMSSRPSKPGRMPTC